MPDRVDLYSTIHKALRARLFDLGIELDRCDFSRPGEVSAAIAVYRRTIGFLREHNQHEDTFVEPALRELLPKILATAAAQHAATEQALAELDELIASGNAAVVPARYQVFLRAYLEHLAFEETTVNEALWQRYTDAELAGIRGRLQGSIPPARFGEWLEIILPAISLSERAAMLGGIKANAPEPAFAAALAVASRVLGASSVEALRARLG